MHIPHVDIGMEVYCFQIRLLNGLINNIDEIMRRLVGTPVNLSRLENTMRSMRDTLRYVESAWMYHGSSPDLINDVCVSLQRAVTVIAEDMKDGLAKVNAQLSNLRTDGNRLRGWRDGSLEIQLRNRHHIHFLARTPWCDPFSCYNSDVVKRKIRVSGGTNRPHSYRRSVWIIH